MPQVGEAEVEQRQVVILAGGKPPLCCLCAISTSTARAGSLPEACSASAQLYHGRPVMAHSFCRVSDCTKAVVLLRDEEKASLPDMAVIDPGIEPLESARTAGSQSRALKGQIGCDGV